MSFFSAAGKADVLSTQPDWPTYMQMRMQDGRIKGTDGSVWLYRAVPQGAFLDAKVVGDRSLTASALMSAYSELSAMASFALPRRQVSRGAYRDSHLLLLNIPTLFTPESDHPQAGHLRNEYGNQPVLRRTLLFGTPLRPTTGGKGGWRAAIDSVAETLTLGGVPDSDYDADFERVDRAFKRAGLIEPTARELRLANAWWNHGFYPDTPMLVHDSHIHFFTESGAVRAAQAAGVERCAEWEPNEVPGQHGITFASVRDLELDYEDAFSDRAAWMCDLLDADALAVSVRAQVEPPRITREELRRNKKGYLDDIRERAAQGKMERAEQDEAYARISEVEALYSDKGATPTLTNTSVLVAFDGENFAVEQALPASSPVQLGVMEHRQRGAHAEMMLCSPIRSNPSVHDLPCQVVAYSGATSLNVVGDADGAVLGFTEADRQITFISPAAASAGDSAPIVLVPGQTGSGKALTLSTKIPTPDGFTTMGELKVGDLVFDRAGNTAPVERVWETNLTPELYRIRTSAAHNVVGDRDHQWIVLDRTTHAHPTTGPQTPHAVAAALRALAPLPNGAVTLEELHTTIARLTPGTPWNSMAEMRAALDMVEVLPTAHTDQRPLYDATHAVLGLAVRLEQQHYGSSGSRPGEKRMTTAEMVAAGLTLPDGTARFAVPLNAALRLDEVALGHDPYVLGASIAFHAHDLHDEVTDAAFARSLRASASQRLAVVHGLLDSCGVQRHDGSRELRLPDARHAHQVVELVQSLGVTARVRSTSPEEGTVITLGALAACGEALDLSSQWADVVSIDPVLPGEDGYEPARCITVGSPDRSYLCGEGFLVTSNTMVLLDLARQFARNVPVIIFDPKQESDHSPLVEATGGQVYSLDELLEADGIFDPIRFSKKADVGVEQATSVLMSINPWGTRAVDYEVVLSHALKYGVANGATCTGEALAIARRDLGHEIPADLFDAVDMMIASSPTFRAICGVTPQGQGLTAPSGITLIKVGNAYLDLPQPGQEATSINQRTAMALVRMVVFGSAMAVSGRNGVVMFDEAWILFLAGAAEMERLGRLARSQQVLPMLFTQRVTDAVKAGLVGYISRGIILPMEDPEEAAAALKMFHIEATPERLGRLTAKDRTAGDSRGARLNWNSMRALVERGRDETGRPTRIVRRGSIGIYCDLAGRAIPVEIRLTKRFLDLASTNPEDLQNRAEAEARRAATRARAQQALSTQVPAPGADLTF